MNRESVLYMCNVRIAVQLRAAVVVGVTNPPIFVLLGRLGPHGRGGYSVSWTVPVA